MHSVPAPINVRCYSNSDIIVRRSEVTLRAINGLMQRLKQRRQKDRLAASTKFHHLIGLDGRSSTRRVLPLPAPTKQPHKKPSHCRKVVKLPEGAIEALR
jgi:hypothetical protein